MVGGREAHLRAASVTGRDRRLSRGSAASARPRAPLRVPGGGVAAHPGLISLAGAVGSATGLSLRSLRAFKIFFRAAGDLQPAAPALPFFAR